MSNGILYLARDDVAALLPPIEEQMAIVDRTLRATSAGRVELPPKLGIHPRSTGFIHAMPAYLGDDDIAALKWVSADFGNTKRGLPSISGLIVVNDSDSGRPQAIMDAGEITAARTAAVSGLCIRRFAPEGWNRVAIVGFGEQGRFHARMLSELNPTSSIVVYSPRGKNGYAGRLDVASSAREAVESADVVVTAAPMQLGTAPPVVDEWLDESCLVLPVDFDASIAPDAVERAAVFLVDDEEQYATYCDKGYFRGWPDPDGAIDGPRDRGGTAGRVVCCNLGVGSLDAAFAARILDEAAQQRVGLRLAR